VSVAPEPPTGGDGCFEIAVVGGGLIGAVAALGAARLGRQVVLVEQAVPTTTLGRLGHDLRTVAVAPATQLLLAELGVWERVTPAPYRAMHIWDERGTATLMFDAAEVGREELGWILENGPTLAALWAVLERQPNLTLRVGAPVTGAQADASGVRLELANGTLEVGLLVAADGARSRVRESLGIGAELRDTGHEALATVVVTERPHGGVARQCFLPDGPVALLPGLDPLLCSVVWSQSPAQASRRVALPDEAFCRELTRATDGCLGAVCAVDRRLAFPLRQTLADDFHPAGRVLLLGDAAHVLHPLAGLGANLGFEDVRALLDVLGRLPPSADPGTATHWTRFARQRRTRARMLIELMTALQRLYAGAGPWPQWVRNTGVRWLNDATPLKRQVMREAMGLGPLSDSGAGMR
jgi:ubiquinone biosynthesis UbiH/UbiF/VisC/COQ6 family hydroxylase